MPNKDLDKERQQPQAPQQGAGAGRKNNEEVGEPVQLNEDMEQEQKGQSQKPGMGQQHPGGQQGKQGGEHQGGQHQGGSHQGGGANR